MYRLSRVMGKIAKGWPRTAPGQGTGRAGKGRQGAGQSIIGYHRLSPKTRAGTRSPKWISRPGRPGIGILVWRSVRLVGCLDCVWTLFPIGSDSMEKASNLNQTPAHQWLRNTSTGPSSFLCLPPPFAPPTITEYLCALCAAPCAPYLNICIRRPPSQVASAGSGFFIFSFLFSSA